MYSLLTHCPVCHEALHVTRLECESCGTRIEGHFELGALSHLNAEQWRFVEVFLRCEGKLNRVQEELGISYPTARARLLDVLRAMGYAVEEPAEAAPEAEPSRVLDELAAGRLSVDEAVKLLRQGRA